MSLKYDKRHQTKGRKTFKAFLSHSIVGNVPLVELAFVLVIALVFYVVASLFDFNERWIEWSEKYEKYELDELPLGFGIIALVLAWFSWRRWVLLNKVNIELARTQDSLLIEIQQREKAERFESEIRQQLEQAIRFQKKRTQRIQAIQEMGELMMFVQSQTEIFNIAVRYAQKIIPFSSGALYKVNDYSLKHLLGWGQLTQADVKDTANYKCWVTRQGKSYAEISDSEEPSLCVYAAGSQQFICVPILTPKGIWGVIHFRQNKLSPQPESKPIDQFENADLENLAKTIADNVGLHIHSLFLREQLTLESIRDPLTGILNRRGLLKLVHEQALLQNSQFPCSVLMMDIDYFKQLNDQFGHDVGDVALVAIADLVTKLIRRQDIFCRYGGEEFLLILINTEKKSALSRAETIRKLVEQHVLKIGHHQFEHLTISIGVATYPEDADDYEVVLKRADQALYRAKELGRNRVMDCTMVKS